MQYLLKSEKLSDIFLFKVMGIKDSALKISGSVLKKMVEKEQQKKPGCMGFLHQPKRPAALKKTK